MNPIEEREGALGNLMHSIKQTTHQDGLPSLSIPKEKDEEIRKLLDLLHQKFERLKMLRDVPCAKRTLERELSEKYVLETKDSAEKDLAAVTLLGLSNLDFQDKEDQKKTCEKCLFLPSEKYCRGVPIKVDYSINYRKAQLDLLEATIAVCREHSLTRASVLRYAEQLVKGLALLQQKQEVLVQAGETLNEGANLLLLDTEASVYEATHEYFTEDEVVVKATRKLKEVLMKEVHDRKFALMEAEAQLVAYQKLQGTDFDDIVGNYKEVLAEIEKKRWTIDQMKKHAEDDSY